MKSQTVFKNVTTGLAGAVAIAGGSQAYGAILSATVPTDILPTTFPTTATATVNWDVNLDGVNDFSFSFRQPQSATGVDWQSSVTVVGTNTVLGYTLSYNYAGRLTAGTPIAAGGGNSFLGGQLFLASNFAGTNYGQFLPPNSTGFIGFRFVANGNTFNGWLRFKTGRSFGIDFISAGYNNTPLGAITAGQTAAVPEPGTVGMLAFGAAGIAGAAAYRRKKAAQPAV